MSPREFNGKTIELLAPAGNIDILKSIVNTKCDALYFGGRSLNMRVIRKGFNFSNEELDEAIKLIHSKGKKAYITVNSLIEFSELDEAKTYLSYLNQIQPDGIIVQDMSILELVNSMNLNLEIHASVMMNVHNIPMVELLKTKKVKRVVVSREMSLKDVSYLKAKTDIEIEYFTHGDMCIAHGAACYYSSMLFGMSSNRGKCLKPCRWWFSYGDSEEKTYPLAVKDLSMFTHLKEMIHSGITSFKLEGRMREKEFLWDLINAYGDKLDEFINDPIGFDPLEGFQDIQEHRKRDLSTGYAFGIPGKANINKRNEGTGKIFSTGKMFSIPTKEPIITEKLTASIRKLGKANLNTNPEPITTSPSNTNTNTITKTNIGGKTSKKLSVKVQTYNQAIKAIELGVNRLYLSGDVFEPNKAFTKKQVVELAKITQKQNTNIELYLATPRMMNEEQLECYHVWITSLLPFIDGLLVSDMGALYSWRHLNIPITGDYGLNVLNPLSANFYAHEGMTSVTTSIELTANQYFEFIDNQTSSIGLETIIYGRLTSMYFEHDFYQTFDATTEKPLILHNEAGEFEIYRDQHKRCHMLTRSTLSLLDIIDVLAEKPSLTYLRYEAQLDDISTLISTITKIQSLMGIENIDTKETNNKQANEQLSETSYTYGALSFIKEDL